MGEKDQLLNIDLIRYQPLELNTDLERKIASEYACTASAPGEIDERTPIY